MEKDKKSALYDAAVEKAGIAVDAMNDGKSSDVVKKLRKDATDAMDAYNTEAAVVAFAKWSADGNPVEYAVRARYVPDARKISFKKNNKTNRYYVEIINDDLLIDPYQLLECVGLDKFHDEKAFSQINDLAYLIANAINKDLGGNVAFSYAVTSAAGNFGLSKQADPKSVSSMVKVLQKTVDGILFLPVKNSKGETVNSIKVTSEAWYYVDKCMSKMNKVPGWVTVASPLTTCALVFNVAYVIINNLKFQPVAG